MRGLAPADGRGLALLPADVWATTLTCDYLAGCVGLRLPQRQLATDRAVACSPLSGEPAQVVWLVRQRVVQPMLQALSSAAPRRGVGLVGQRYAVASRL